MKYQIIKKIILSFLGLPFIILTATSFAQTERIIVRGQPIIIQNQNGVYVPATAVTTQDYYFFTVDNTKRVCYPAVQDVLERAKLPYRTFQVQFATGVVNLYCYEFSTNYFLIQ